MINSTGVLNAQGSCHGQRLTQLCLFLQDGRPDPCLFFLKTASYGDTLAVHVTVKEWRDKSFVQTYRITREDDLIMECEEVRIFATTRNDGKNSIRAVPVLPSIRVLCE